MWVVYIIQNRSSLFPVFLQVGRNRKSNYNRQTSSKNKKVSGAELKKKKWRLRITWSLQLYKLQLLLSRSDV